MIDPSSLVAVRAIQLMELDDPLAAAYEIYNDVQANIDARKDMEIIRNHNLKVIEQITLYNEAYALEVTANYLQIVMQKFLPTTIEEE